MRLNWNSVAEIRSRLAAVTDNGIKPRRYLVVKWACDWVGCFLRIKTSFDGPVRESHLGVGRARPLHGKDKEDGHSLSAALGTGSGPDIHGGIRLCARIRHVPCDDMVAQHHQQVQRAL